MSKINAIVHDLRSGLGAIRLRPDVKKVSLTFSRRSDNAGARYFLRENMPRLQYNNPTIQFEVNKVQEPGVSPELIIEFANNDTKKISCSRIKSSQICKEFLSATTEGSASTSSSPSSSSATA
ncbi:hypothetical protein BC939DRAFT_529708 [Gamsiella multidivaricata]|uniref:uncharacterized protein n=1 Tax=Gamsiella multidivaricata TaxID=101098 RepID=UPI002220204B|nr:uncharacterized protein BC939DRAFT_529708 [Gamsiella multidivaricata]KAG0350926.1 hypothetical protein BGZ54_003527 [Gamsiella multidivaricata]KAI7821983.1 hypothetical protein BC939DRAFT_529708 [Gamsiella multidivaricata]